MCFACQLHQFQLLTMSPTHIPATILKVFQRNYRCSRIITAKCPCVYCQGFAIRSCSVDLWPFVYFCHLHVHWENSLYTQLLLHFSRDSIYEAIAEVSLPCALLNIFALCFLCFKWLEHCLQIYGPLFIIATCNINIKGTFIVCHWYWNNNKT